mmetsp:Transcript_4027/g.12235  ORF Transcript_4027/g.12235 Transcript_4027/m.12235 type:complete len:201 (-) Transcript_4027:1410-2012(-)
MSSCIVCKRSSWMACDCCCILLDSAASVWDLSLASLARTKSSCASRMLVRSSMPGFNSMYRCARSAKKPWPSGDSAKVRSFFRLSSTATSRPSEASCCAARRASCSLLAPSEHSFSTCRACARATSSAALLGTRPGEPLRGPFLPSPRLTVPTPVSEPMRPKARFGDEDLGRKVHSASSLSARKRRSDLRASALFCSISL